jgi:hypothetical protein
VRKCVQAINGLSEVVNLHQRLSDYSGRQYARQRQSRSIVLSVESVTDADFLSRLTGHFTDRF